MTQTGRIDYTQRAFEQDADLAMSGDVIRALVELVTTADDAYGEADGEIRIELSRPSGEHPSISVCDSAKGLLPDDMRACFGVLGGMTSGFDEGQAVRGLLGRGAKDTAAFGRTVFEAVKDGVYSRFELRRDGSWSLDSDPASDEHRQRVGLADGRSGLRATVVVETGVDVPNTRVLVERLRDHVQLRPVTSTRVTVVADATPGRQQRSDVARWEPPEGEVLVETELELDGYPDAHAHLVLTRLVRPGEGRVSQYSRHGIEVRGGSAAFVNTFFGETSPEVAWLHGRLECPYIDELIRAYDREEGRDPANPSRLLRRDREGLTEEHPFYVALATAVARTLAPILAELRPRQEAESGGDELQRDLDKAGRALAALLRGDLQRLEEDEPGGGVAPTEASPLLVIPPRLSLAPGSARSLTVLANSNVIADEAALEASVRNPAVATVDGVSAFVEHATLPATRIARLPVHAIAEGATVITVTHVPTGYHASCDLSVLERVVDPDPAPEALEWANASMSVAVNKQRTVRLRAPIELGPAGSLTAAVAIEGDGVGLLDEAVELTLVDGGWLEGRCGIEGRKADSSATITAQASG
jgi:hypothetical protein